LPGYELAGKTGTAQKRNSGGGYVSNFVGFVPADKPTAIILVMIDHPRKGAYYGASVAGPVFKHMAEAVIRRYQLPPTRSVTVAP
jgi:cell division protein FtsI (penicillin-binding protein 3)